MAEALKTRTADLQFGSPPIDDVTSTAETMLDQALHFATSKAGLSPHQQAAEQLRQGNRTVCRYWHYSLAQQVAELLGALDEHVQAVYLCEYDATPEDLCFRETAALAPIHLLVWAKKKSAALGELIETLEYALIQAGGERIGLPRLDHLLDVQIADDLDVSNRTGYAALLSSLYNRPIPVWER